MDLLIKSSQLEELKLLVNEDGLNYIKKLESIRDIRLDKLNKKKLRKLEKQNIQKQRRIDNREDAAKKFREKLVKNQTNSEKKFKAILKMAKIEYEFQKIYIFEESFRIVDFYLPKQNVVIEIDGEYHNDKDQQLDDRRRTRQLIQSGVRKVFRFKNKEIDNTEGCILRLKAIEKDF